MALIRPADTVVESNRRNQAEFALHRFPDDLGPHAMVMNIKDYTYRGGVGDNEVRLESSIVLPLPTNIADSYQIDVDRRELGILGAATADAIAGNLNPSEVLKDIEQSIRGVLGQAGGAAGSALAGNFDPGFGFLSDAASAARYFTRAALTALPGGSDVSAGIDIATGTTINPHAALVFDGILLKNHDFRWEFSPKSSSESTKLRDIINKLKVASLPRYENPFGQNTGQGQFYDRALLKYPKMVDIFFVGLDQSYYFYFKTCMIKSISVDYSPQGNALYKAEGGSRPVFINFAISLAEASIHTAADYDDITTTSLGSSNFSMGV